VAAIARNPAQFEMLQQLMQASSSESSQDCVPRFIQNERYVLDAATQRDLSDSILPDGVNDVFPSHRQGRILPLPNAEENDPALVETDNTDNADDNTADKDDDDDDEDEDDDDDDDDDDDEDDVVANADDDDNEYITPPWLRCLYLLLSTCKTDVLAVACRYQDTLSSSSSSSSSSLSPAHSLFQDLFYQIGNRQTIRVPECVLEDALDTLLTLAFFVPAPEGDESEPKFSATGKAELALSDKLDALTADQLSSAKDIIQKHYQSLSSNIITPRLSLQSQDSNGRTVLVQAAADGRLWCCDALLNFMSPVLEDSSRRHWFDELWFLGHEMTIDTSNSTADMLIANYHYVRHRGTVGTEGWTCKELWQVFRRHRAQSPLVRVLSQNLMAYMVNMCETCAPLFEEDLQLETECIDQELQKANQLPNAVLLEMKQRATQLREAYQAGAQDLKTQKAKLSATKAERRAALEAEKKTWTDKQDLYIGSSNNKKAIKQLEAQIKALKQTAKPVDPLGETESQLNEKLQKRQSLQQRYYEAKLPETEPKKTVDGHVRRIQKQIDQVKHTGTGALDVIRNRPPPQQYWDQAFRKADEQAAVRLQVKTSATSKKRPHEAVSRDALDVLEKQLADARSKLQKAQVQSSKTRFQNQVDIFQEEIDRLKAERERKQRQRERRQNKSKPESDSDSRTDTESEDDDDDKQEYTHRSKRSIYDKPKPDVPQPMDLGALAELSWNSREQQKILQLQKQIKRMQQQMEALDFDEEQQDIAIQMSELKLDAQKFVFAK
jgi:hypothetical protein